MVNLLTLTSIVNFLALAMSLWLGFFSSPLGTEKGNKPCLGHSHLHRR